MTGQGQMSFVSGDVYDGSFLDGVPHGPGRFTYASGDVSSKIIFRILLGLLLKESVSITAQCTEVRFASFLSGGLITAIVKNPPERKLAKRTSVHCATHSFFVYVV